MATTRLLFAGCGGIARHHLRALQASGRRWEVSALVDPNTSAAEALATELRHPDNCMIFRDLSEALTWGGFDAAVLMVPHDLHEPLTMQCLAAGKHVLLEKPLSHTLESCVRLVGAAEEARSVFMVGENSAFWPEVVKTQELLQAGAIGTVYSAHANYWESIGLGDFMGDDLCETSWRWDPARVGGGVLMDGATHWIRPMRIWFGEVAEVVGVMGRPLQLCRGESLVHSILQFSSGLHATLHCHFNTVPMQPLPFFHLSGDKGEISVDGSFDGGLTLHTKAGQHGRRWTDLGGYSGTFLPQMQLFLAAVEGGREEGGLVRESIRASLGEVLVAKALYKSRDSHRWEAVTVRNLLQ